MKKTVTVTWSRLVYGLLALLAIGISGAFLVAWSGIYSVAASRGHPAWLNGFLELGMRRSVEMNAPDLKEPDLSDAGLIALGASHFQGGCAPCHGAPGKPVNPIFEAMLPAPPSLAEQTGEWTPDQLHWIVRHGLQYAGMPGWAATQRDDEVWAMVAFLQALPAMSEATYETLAAGNAEHEDPAAKQLIAEGRSTSSLATCSKCHDTLTAPPTGSLVPRLGNQSREYLERALNDYRAARRHSGFMQPVAAEIPESEFSAIAAYFSTLDSPSHPHDPAPQASLDAGMAIALQGAPRRRVAACQACHGADANPTYPRLAGQSADYLNAQLQLWRDNPPSETGYGELMAGAVGKITDEQMRDVSAWYASQAVALPPSDRGGGGE
jgi:cytochrome c553